MSLRACLPARLPACTALQLAPEPPIIRVRPIWPLLPTLLCPPAPPYALAVFYDAQTRSSRERFGFSVPFASLPAGGSCEEHKRLAL